MHGLGNKIQKGENSGKTFKHNFVVSEFFKINFNKKATVSLKVRHKDYKERSIVFWISNKESQIPIQAVGGCIENSMALSNPLRGKLSRLTQLPLRILCNFSYNRVHSLIK
jgi:hypothetical protein